MLRLILVSLFLLPGLVQAQSSPWSFPDVEEVIRQFYTNYRLEPEPGLELHFARKKDGWYLITTQQRSWNPVASEEIFWSVETGSFLPVDFDGIPADSRPNVEYHLRTYFERGVWMRHHYEGCRYMGYATWMDDMIRDLDTISGLDLVDLEGLARAHNAKCDLLLHSSYGLRSGTAIGYEYLEDSPLLDSVIHHYSRCIDLYHQIEEQQPGYETFIGPVGLKLANEYLTAWHALLSVRRPDQAAQFLPDSIYSEYILNYARLLLVSCPEEALLLVNGDNDYFPLLYLQANQGLRQDVKVVNQAWLNTVWYQQMIADRLPGNSAPVGFLPDEDLLEKMSKNYLWLREYPGGESARLPGGIGSWELPIQGVGEHQYLSANQVWLAEWFRFQALRPSADPFCVSSTLNPQYVQGLFGHLENRGLLYVLVADEFPARSDEPLAYYMGRYSHQYHRDLVESLLETDLWPSAPDSVGSYHRMLALVALPAAYLYHFFLIDRNEESEEDIRQAVERWSDQVLPLLREGESPTDTYYMAQLAILCYAAGLDDLGSEWEGRIYRFLDSLIEDPEMQVSAEDRTRSLTGLRFLGYYFQESDREGQYLALTQTLEAYEVRMMGQ